MISAILSVLFIATGLVGDAPPSKINRPAMNQEIKLKVGEKVSIRRAGLNVTFVEVKEDSRCPRNVTCVWAGNGRVTLRVLKSGSRPVEFDVNTGVNPKHYAYRGYDFKLTDLSPYPENQTPINKGDYVATVIVSRK